MKEGRKERRKEGGQEDMKTASKERSQAGRKEARKEGSKETRKEGQKKGRKGEKMERDRKKSGKREVEIIEFSQDPLWRRWENVNKEIIKRQMKQTKSFGRVRKLAS